MHILSHCKFLMQTGFHFHLYNSVSLQTREFHDKCWYQGKTEQAGYGLNLPVFTNTSEKKKRLLTQ